MSKKSSPEARAAIRRGILRWHARRKEDARVTPADLRRLRQEGLVAEGLRPLLKLAAQEAQEITAALGGDLSPQRKLLLEDATMLGIAARVILRAYLETGTDHELASRLSTVLGSRRQALNLLGLERLEREVEDALAPYRRVAEARASGPNGSSEVQGLEPVGDRSAQADERSEREADEAGDA